MNFNTNKNYYGILGVEPTASFENIVKAKDRLKFGSEDDRVPFFMWNDIDEAYKVLSSSELRREYDKFLESQSLENVSPVVTEEVETREPADFQMELPTEAEVPDEVLENEELKSEEILDNEKVYTQQDIEEPIKKEPTEDIYSDLEHTNNSIPDNLIDENLEIDFDKDTTIEKNNEELKPEGLSDTQQDLEEPVKVEPMEEIYSNSDHSNSSIFNNSTNDNSNYAIDESIAFKEVEKKQHKGLKISNNVKSNAIGFAAGAAVAGTVALVGGTLVPVVLGGVAGTILVSKLCKKITKFKLHKDKKVKKIKDVKLTSAEVSEIEKYNDNLEKEINHLLSEPNNNYKLEINRIKYENQVKLLRAMLEVKQNKEIKKSQLFAHKIDLIYTKNQLETAIKKLESINEKVSKYNRGTKLSKLNEELIDKNKQIKEAEAKGQKPFGLVKLKTYKTKIQKRRDKVGTKLKTRLVRSGEFYNRILKAKDFVVALPAGFKKTETISTILNEQPIEEQVQRTR